MPLILPPKASKPTTERATPTACGPAHGVGERRRHDLVVPLLYPWRKRGQSRWRVGWHGSSCWLLCLCVLCFVFVLQPMTRRLYLFWGGRNFFQFCNNWCLYFDTTPDDCTFFFRVVIFSGCNLNPPKNLDYDRRPDDCTLFWGGVIIFSGGNLNPPLNMAGQTTVPFFLVVIFPVVCKYHNWCSCQNTNTNHDPKKLGPKKKRYSCLVGYVFGTTGKNYNPPKKGTVV
jgi:hypothetical protein